MRRETIPPMGIVRGVSGTLAQQMFNMSLSFSLPRARFLHRWRYPVEEPTRGRRLSLAHMNTHTSTCVRTGRNGLVFVVLRIQLLNINVSLVDVLS